MNSSSGDRRTVGVLLGLVGITAIVIGVFLPIWDQGSVLFGSITGNSLLQSGDGIWGLGIAGIALFELYRAWKGGKGGLWMMITGAGVTVYAIWLSQNAAHMTLCPATATDLSDPACQVADPGLGLFAVGAGGVAIAVSGLIMLAGKVGPVRVLAEEEADVPPAAPPVFDCPHCLEQVKVGATVCPHCQRDIASAAAI